MMSRLTWCFCVLPLIGCGPLTAQAHDISLTECVEAGEFVRNAALSRDAGMARETFIAKMADDLALIQAFPPALRWFVQDSFDEELLTGAVVRVFDQPMAAEQHEQHFVSECMQTVARSDEEI
jgi:hypothetical protein